MTREEIHHLKTKQEEFFLTGKTLEVSYRLEAIRKLHQAILNHQEELEEALRLDLGKSKMESDMCEVRLTLSEASYMLKRTRRYAKGKRVKTSLANWVATSHSLPSPYGNVLIMSPWNYPVLLTLEPLVDALAAGNTAILKPSAYSPNATAVIKRLIEETFPQEYVAVVPGGRKENSSLLEENFDYIFFTGSKSVGKLVMEKAAPHLTPVTLELGGKSPVVVTKDANLKLTARRLVFGKYLNCGQTCVAPDYVLVEHSVKDALVEEVKKEIKRQFGQKPLENQDYGKIISEKHFSRVLNLLDKEKIVYGGNYDAKALRLEPTVMDHVTKDDKVMQEEIFGPILPILTYGNLEEAISFIRGQEHPLAFYVFSSDRKTQDRLLSEIGFGGGCVNDTIMHLASSEMGFGGFRESGMGQYHGKCGFDTFSHYKSIVKKANWIDAPLRYQPYQEKMRKIINLILK